MPAINYDPGVIRAKAAYERAHQKVKVAQQGIDKAVAKAKAAIRVEQKARQAIEKAKAKAYKKATALKKPRKRSVTASRAPIGRPAGERWNLED